VHFYNIPITNRLHSVWLPRYPSSCWRPHPGRRQQATSRDLHPDVLLAPVLVSTPSIFSCYLSLQMCIGWVSPVSVPVDSRCGLTLATRNLWLLTVYSRLGTCWLSRLFFSTLYSRDYSFWWLFFLMTVLSDDSLGCSLANIT